MAEEAALKRLLEAAGAGDRETVIEILDSKCDVNVVDGEGWSPLILASKVQKMSSMHSFRFMHHAHCSIHLACQTLHLPITFLLQAGDINMVDYLLERGATPNPAAVAHTALRAASIFGHSHVARRLLEAQADPNFCSLFGRTPLMGAAMNKHPALVRILLEAKV